MGTTIMTEKITRRGVHTPDSYHPDVLNQLTVRQAVHTGGLVIEDRNTVEEVRLWLETDGKADNYYIVVDENQQYTGIISASSLFGRHQDGQKQVGALIKRKPVFLREHNTLKEAVARMVEENVDVLPVLSSSDDTVIGLLPYQNILSTYYRAERQQDFPFTNISVKRSGMRMLVKGRKILTKKKAE